MTDEEALELKPRDRVRVIAGGNDRQRARIGQIGRALRCYYGDTPNVIVEVGFSDAIVIPFFANKLELLTVTTEDLQKALAEAEQELQSWPSP